MRQQLSDYEDVDHPSVPDYCAQCGCVLAADERDICERCRDDYYREKAADEAYDDAKVNGKDAA